MLNLDIWYFSDVIGKLEISLDTTKNSNFCSIFQYVKAYINFVLNAEGVYFFVQP